MRRSRVIWISVVALLLIAFAGWRILESAEPTHQLLTGQLWQTMSPDAGWLLCGESGASWSMSVRRPVPHR